MRKSIKDLLGPGVETVPFSNEIRVTKEMAAQLAAEDPDVAPYGRPMRKSPWTMAAHRTPTLPNMARTASKDVPGDIRAINERLDDFIKRAMTARNFFLETLAGAIVYGMGIPPDQCVIVNQPNHFAPIGQTRTDLNWINPKQGTFEAYERRWRDAPGFSAYGKVTACNAAVLTHEWRELMEHPDRTAGQTDHQLLVLAFIRVLGCLPTQVEMATETMAQGSRVRWRYRRREDAGSTR